jgi:hypothetical protein
MDMLSVWFQGGFHDGFPKSVVKYAIMEAAGSEQAICLVVAFSSFVSVLGCASRPNVRQDPLGGWGRIQRASPLVGSGKPPFGRHNARESAGDDDEHQVRGTS